MKWIGLGGVLLCVGPLWALPGTYLVKPDQLLRTDRATGQVVAPALNFPIDPAFHNLVETQSGLLVVGSARQITLVDPESWQVRATLAIPRVIEAQVSGDVTTLEATAPRQGKLFGLGYAGASNQVYAGISNGRKSFLYQIDPTLPSIRVLTELPMPNPLDLVVSGDGLRIYVAALRYLPQPAAQVWSVNPTTGVVSPPLEIAYDPTRPQLSLSPDGNRLYLIAANQSIITLNTRTNRIINRTLLGQGDIIQILSDPDNRHLWISTRDPDQVLRWDPLGETEPIRYPGLPVDLAPTGEQSLRLLKSRSLETRTSPTDKPTQQTALTGGIQRVIATSGPQPPRPNVKLKRLAILGFESNLPSTFPDVVQVMAGDLLWTRQYELISPRQVASVLAALDLTPEQIRTSRDVLRQVAQGLQADVLLVGEPLQIEAPEQLSNALFAFGGALLGIPLPLGQLNTPRVKAKAQAHAPNGDVFWQADVVNFDGGFLQGKNDLLLVNNALIITAHDLANKFSQGAYERVKSQTLAQDPPPLVQQPDLLKQIRTIAILGPDEALERSNPPESLGQVFAEQLKAQLQWQALTPDQSNARLAQLGIEPVQALSTDPRLLASLLGVDAVCIGLVRGNTFYTGTLISSGTTSDTIIQYAISDKSGAVVWQDIQGTNVPGFFVDERNTAARQVVQLMINKLKGVLRR